MQIVETIVVIVVNGAIMAFAVWLIVDWRRKRRRFTRAEGVKQAIVRWRYPVEEWQRFCDAEARRLVRDGVPGILLVFAGPAIFMVAAIWYMHDPAKDYMFDPRIAIWPLLGAIALILVGLVLWRAWDYARLRSYDCEMAIGHEGLYETYRRDGEIRLERKTLFGPDYDLAGVTLRRDGDHRYLALALRGHKGASAEKRIPVPRGHEPQAERVVQALSVHR